MKAEQTSRAFLGAYRKGRQAAADGKAPHQCPYDDLRGGKRGNIITYSRTFRRMWHQGFHDERRGFGQRYCARAAALARSGDAPRAGHDARDVKGPGPHAITGETRETPGPARARNSTPKD